MENGKRGHESLLEGETEGERAADEKTRRAEVGRIEDISFRLPTSAFEKSLPIDFIRHLSPIAGFSVLISPR